MSEMHIGKHDVITPFGNLFLEAMRNLLAERRYGGEPRPIANDTNLPVDMRIIFLKAVNQPVEV